MSSDFPKAKIGIIGGSGFYSLFDNAEEFEMDTPYGKPSDKISIGEIAGRSVVFLPRHGKGHCLSPTSIPYRANLWALKQLGVERIIAPTATGSLQPHIKPGDFVICDQFVDRTKHREDSFFHGPKVAHISCADPFCEHLREAAILSCRNLSITAHEKGTAVVIEGPRFSSRAESNMYQRYGFDVIGMTQYPESVLARELEMCYVNISLVTDYDAGLLGQEGDKNKAVDAASVIEVFNKNISRLKDLIAEMIKNLPQERSCVCKDVLKSAMM